MNITESIATLNDIFAHNAAMFKAKQTNHMAYLVPMLLGSPGSAKSSMVRQVAKKNGAKCIELSLANYEYYDLAGWNVGKDDTMLQLRPAWMPAVNDKGPGVIFVDELPQAPIPNKNVAATLIHERRIGPHYLPDGWQVVAAGNRAKDRAGTTPIPSHVRGRVIMIEVSPTVEEVATHFIATGVHPSVPAFLRFMPQYLDAFDPAADSSPTARGWEFVGTIQKAINSPTARTEAMAGVVGAEAAHKYVAYSRLYESIPDVDNIIANPTTASVEMKADVRFAVCASLAAKSGKDNLSAIVKYISRFEQQEFAAMVANDMMAKATAKDEWHFTTNADFTKWMASVGVALFKPS